MARLDWTIPVRTLVHQLQNRDFLILGVDDGEDYIPIIYNQGSYAERSAATDVITAVDESWLKITKDGKTATLFIVLGNEPEELVADYVCSKGITCDLEEAIDAHANQWEGKRCPVAA